MADNQHKHLCFRVSKVTPRDGGGTQNRQKSANMTAVKENANICKIDFPVLCTFTLLTQILHILAIAEKRARNESVVSLVMLIVISIAF